MAGVPGHKGAGGRKPAYDEKVRTAVINKCWQFLLEEMEREDTPRSVKRDIAKSLATKSVPTDINVASAGFEINIK